MNINISQNLLVIETLEQAAVLHAALIDSSVQTVVALSAEVDDHLDVLGIEHFTIEDFYSEAELMLQAANNNAAINELCAALDRLAGVEVKNKLPPFSAYYHRGRLRVMYDAFQRAAFCVGAMLDRLAPTSARLGRALPPDTAQIWISEPDFLTYVLEHLCRQRGIPVETVEVPEPAPRTGVSLLGRLVEQGRNVRDFMRRHAHSRGDIAYFFWPDMPDAALKTAGLRSVALPKASRAAANLWSGDLSALEPFFRFRGNNLFQLAGPHLREFLGRFRSRNLRQLRRTERLVARAEAKACLATAPVNIEAVNALLAARRAGKPAIVLQHGGFNGYADYDILPFTDFSINDHYVCYGPGVGEALAPLAKETSQIRAVPVAIAPTGSATVYSIYRNRAVLPKNARPRVIYVPAILGGSIRYMAGHLRPDIAYWRQQRNVLKLLMSFPEWDVHFRPPPPNLVRNPVTAWLERQPRHNVHVRSGGTFGGLLMNERFDLIVTDAVTTVMLEALATDAAVVAQFDGTVMKLRPEAETLLRKRAAAAFSEDGFLSEIAARMKQPLAAETIDDSFLFQYALASKDSDPVKLQIEALRKALQTPRAA